MINNGKVAMDPDKVTTVSKWPTPRTVKELRGFVGLTGYYMKFIRNDGHIAEPLTNLLKKDSFNWTLQATEAFKKLKEALMSGPVFTLPDFSLRFAIECDA